MNQVGDSVPSNNCGVKIRSGRPGGGVRVAEDTWTIKSTQTSNNLSIWITNLGSFTARPIRVAENMTVTVRVNGGPAQNVAPPAEAPFALGPNLGTDEHDLRRGRTRG